MPYRIAPPARSQPGGWLPLAALNLRENPFGECTAQQRAELAVVDLDPARRFLEGTRRAVQFIGDCGRGKSTHLHALRVQLSSARYVYLPEVGRPPRLPDADPLLVDEAQRLSAWRRWRLLRRGSNLVLGTHVDLGKPLRRAGYRVQTIRVAESLTATQIAKIANRRIAAVRLGLDRPIPRLSVAEAARLQRCFGTDVRAMESYLYERIQQYAGVDRGEMQLVD